MFEVLSQKLNTVLRSLGDKGKLSEKDVDEALRQIRLAFLEADVNFRVVKSFLARVREQALSARVLESLTPAQQIVKAVNRELVNILGGEPSHLLGANRPPSIVILVGLQGSGKTTTAAKLALHLRHLGQRPALVAADTRRPAAIDQLVTLGEQLNIPVYHEDAKAAPITICRQALRWAQEVAATWVVIDTQGRLHIDETMLAELTQLKAEIRPSEILLVVDAMTGQDAVNIAEAFNRNVGLTGLILTKMDGDARGGAALSIRFVIGVPVKFIGTGEKTDALELFHPERLASRILGMGDMLTLVEKAEKAFDEQHIGEIEKKIRASRFDLEDLLWQIRQVEKMGTLAQLAEMLPAFSKSAATSLGGAEESQVRKTEAIILSMTPEERRNPAIISGSRRRRIAQGSGTMRRDVNQLLSQFYQIQELTRIVAKGRWPRNLMDMLRQ